MIRSVITLASLAVLTQQAPRELVFRSEVRRVLVDVFVSRDGTPVTELAADAFELFDNGVQQSDLELVKIERIPLDVLLLLDGSRSVRGNKLDALRAAAREFLDELESSDAASVATFGTRFRLEQALTPDRESAIAVLPRIRGSGATSLFDSLVFSLIYLDESSGRPLVVLFSDGLDTASWLNASDVVSAARRSDAIVFSVRVHPGGTGVRMTATESLPSVSIEADLDSAGRAVLDRVARETGGRVLSLTASADVSSAFRDILSEMRSRYVLAYRPTDSTEGWHQLTVRLKDGAGADLRARAGYYSR